MDHNTHTLDAVDDELEIGFDQKFERKWRRLELASQVVMGLFVLAALAGLFGRGPFSHRTYRTADGRLALDFEPVVRAGTTTQITVHFFTPEGSKPTGEGAADPARLFVSSTVMEPLGLQRVIPQPDGAKAVAGGAVYQFAIPATADSAAVRFMLKPSGIGLVSAEVSDISRGRSLAWRQLVLP
jgi:hypothetical protein